MKNEKCVSFSAITDIPGIFQAGFNTSNTVSWDIQNSRKLMDLLVSTKDSTTNFEIFYFLYCPVLNRDSHEVPWEEKYLSLPSEVILSDFGILFN